MIVEPVDVLAVTTAHEHSSCRDRLLTGAPAWSFVGNDCPVSEVLAAPDTPWLAPLDRTGETLQPHGTVPADLLGPLYVCRRLREEQLGIVRPTWQTVIGRGEEQFGHASGRHQGWTRATTSSSSTVGCWPRSVARFGLLWTQPQNIGVLR
jgi:hypothetical protein